RNPAVAASLTAVLLILSAGIVISAYFAIAASQQAGVADAQAETALKKEKEALAAKSDLEKANVELTRKSDELELTLVRGILRPLASEPGPLSDSQAEAFKDLARYQAGQLSYRFLEV